MKKLFGTDGIRGLANVEPLTADFAYKLGKSTAILFDKNNEKRSLFLIGKDTRLSCDMLENAITAGLCSYGADVIKTGIIPTPAIAYLTKKYEADAGIVISASHNSFEDNGIKFFSNEGYKLPEKIEDELTHLLLNDDILFKRPVGSEIGRVIENDRAGRDYIDHIKNTIPQNIDLSHLIVVLDCANGATSFLAPELFRKLGIKTIVKHNNPNGTNINLNCGSLYPNELSEEVRKSHAHIGICFDGDGDRVIALDENGQMIDGDFIMAICSDNLFRNKHLMNKTLITTVMSNIGLEKFTDNSGIKMVRANVGDKYVLEEMIKHDAYLGGEQSGHIIFRKYNTTGDGMITALQLLSIMVNEDKKLSLLAKIMKKYPQILVNVEVREKKDFYCIPDIKKVIDEIESDIASEGRLLLRYSGTEPLARIMLEGENETRIKKMADKLAEVIKINLG
ncbi:phosphoglucosamine mutase [Candidatus Poribacteria bacterium]|nr:phosphoglucosamine mutase [Candidatus Poribacteria bacterium]